MVFGRIVQEEGFGVFEAPVEVIALIENCYKQLEKWNFPTLRVLVYREHFAGDFIELKHKADYLSQTFDYDSSAVNRDYYKALLDALFAQYERSNTLEFDAASGVWAPANLPGEAHDRFIERWASAE